MQFHSGVWEVYFNLFKTDLEELKCNLHEQIYSCPFKFDTLKGFTQVYVGGLSLQAVHGDVFYRRNICKLCYHHFFRPVCATDDVTT